MLCLKKGRLFDTLKMEQKHIFASHCDQEGSLYTVEKLLPALSVYYTTKMLKYFPTFIAPTSLYDVYGFCVCCRKTTRGARWALSCVGVCTC